MRSSKAASYAAPVAAILGGFGLIPFSVSHPRAASGRVLGPIRPITSSGRAPLSLCRRCESAHWTTCTTLSSQLSMSANALIRVVLVDEPR